MIELLPDIFHTDSDRLFVNKVETHAYLVTLATGNLLFYSSSLIGRDFDFIRSKGGILKQYLNHRDEASEYCDVVRRRFNAPLICHELERDAVSEHCEVSATFSERHNILPFWKPYPRPVTARAVPVISCNAAGNISCSVEIPFILTMVCGRLTFMVAEAM